MNDNHDVEQAAKGTVTPPPFRQHELSQEALAQEPAASPTLADRTAALGLDTNTAQRLCQLVEGMDHEAITDDVITTLARGITHDDDVQNADAAGYLRGRNEKIEAVLQPEPDQEPEEPEPMPSFPRYCRRSIWDKT
jgi:hypothetical protein